MHMPLLAGEPSNLWLNPVMTKQTVSSINHGYTTYLSLGSWTPTLSKSGLLTLTSLFWDGAITVFAIEGSGLGFTQNTCFRSILCNGRGALSSAASSFVNTGGTYCEWQWSSDLFALASVVDGTALPVFITPV